MITEYVCMTVYVCVLQVSILNVLSKAQITIHPGGLGGGLAAAIAVIFLLLLLVSVLSGALLVVVMKRSKHETIDKLNLDF